VRRGLAQVQTLPSPGPGFIGEGHTAIHVIDAREFTKEIHRRRNLLDLAAYQVASNLVGEAHQPSPVFDPRLAESSALGEEGHENHVSVDGEAAGILFALWQAGGEAGNIGGGQVSVGNSDDGGVLAGPLGLE